MAAPTLNWIATAPDGTSLVVRQVVARNSPESWMRDADWDEYVLQVRNASAQVLRIDRFDLYGAALFAKAPARCDLPAACMAVVGGENPISQSSTTSLKELESGSGAALKRAKDAGIIVGSGLVPVGAAVAIVGTGGVLAASSATLAAATGAIILAPVAVTIAAVHVVRRHRQKREDNQRIERRLADRGAHVPLILAAGEWLETSAFFPITPAPTRIGIHYVLSGEARELWLSLPALQALHLKSAAALNETKPARSEAIQ